MKNFFKAVAIFIGAYTTIMAADTLVIGCRPWDENIQTVNGLSQAHFVDFRNDGVPAEASNFHHLDLNDDGPYSKETDYYKGPSFAGKFSEFAQSAAGQFNTIIIDWITYHHIRRPEVWGEFFSLLSAGGRLVVPVTWVDMRTGISISVERAQELCAKLQPVGFSQTEILSHEFIVGDESLNLLSQDRGGMLANALSMRPAIIVASK